jgi:hypothetical protein
MLINYSPGLLLCCCKWVQSYSIWHVLHADLNSKQISGPDTADMYRIRGNFSLRLDQVDLARQLFGTASSILGCLEQSFAEVESKALRGSANATGIQVEQPEGLVPSLAASILRQRSEQL